MSRSHVPTAKNWRSGQRLSKSGGMKSRKAESSPPLRDVARVGRLIEKSVRSNELNRSQAQQNRKTPDRRQRQYPVLFVFPKSPVVRGSVNVGFMRPFPVIFISLCCALAACGGIGLAYDQKLVGNYGLAATDVMQQMSFVRFEASGSAIGIVSETVFAAGWNERFVILKRHPAEANRTINKSITEYYIFSVNDAAVRGPLSEAEFQKARLLLRVPEGLTFTLVFEALK